MQFYDIFMYPLEKGVLNKLRRRLIPEARGSILEIGAGTGANLPFYTSEQCVSVTAADKETGRFSKHINEDIDFFAIEADVETLPFETNTFDSVVETLLLCSVENVRGALSEIHRVLKPGGQFIHIDHGLPERKGLRRIFKALAPVWFGMTRSCRIDKAYQAQLSAAGFTAVEQGQAGFGVFYWGIYQKA